MGKSGHTFVCSIEVVLKKTTVFAVLGRMFLGIRKWDITIDFTIQERFCLAKRLLVCKKRLFSLELVKLCYLQDMTACGRVKF